MSTEVTLPALGESVTEGTISRWLKTVGDTIDVDEPLVEVSTDKVDTEVPSPATGTLLDIRVQEDEDAEVGSVLAIIGDAEAQPALLGGHGDAEVAELGQPPQQRRRCSLARRAHARPPRPASVRTARQRSISALTPKGSA